MHSSKFLCREFGSWGVASPAAPYPTGIVPEPVCHQKGAEMQASSR